MDQNDKNIQLVEQIKSLFKMGPVVLIMGKHCEEELSEQLLKLEWNCVFTSSRQQDLATHFAIESKRMPINITELEQMESLGSKIIDRKNLSIVRLYGITGLVNEEDEKLTERARRILKQSKARKMLDYLPSIIGRQFGWVIIVGYDPFDTSDIDQNDLYTALRDLDQPIVRFFGLDEQAEKESIIADLINEGIAKSYSMPISKLFDLCDEDEEDEIIYTQKEEGKSIFIDGRTYPVDNNITFETEGFVQLLTIEDVRNIILRKRGQQIEWFYDFLKLSAEQPQWYGYNTTSDFHLHRYFEDNLIRLVEARLGNCHLPDRVKDATVKIYENKNNPVENQGTDNSYDKIDATSEKKAILLCGHPCSSKTITLGALAYKVFDKKKYPVVFISNPDINLSQNSSSFAALDKLLEKLENLGASNILLIWDCSSYNNLGNSVCKKLNDALLNRGRKVVLVCSSYEQPPQFYKEQKDYTKDGSIIQVRNFYVIKSSQELTEDECEKLKDLVIEKSGINRNAIENYWSNPKNTSSNLLARLYTMIYELHPQLEFGLSREYNTSIGNIKAALSSMPPVQHEKTSMEVAFKKSNIHSEDGIKDEEVKLNWEDFTAVIAMFSRFKLDTPISLAMNALNLPLNSSSAKVYQKIINMPWLIYSTSGMNEFSGDYMFSFRSSLEAEIYLNNNGINATSQIEYIAKMLDYVGKENLGSRSLFSTSSQKLERLIRIIGPNSDNIQLKSGILMSDYRAFQAGYPIIIKALEKLRTEYKYEDPKLINQEVTFIREYYGTICENFNPVISDPVAKSNNFIERINMLNSAIITANKVINGLNIGIKNMSKAIVADKSVYNYQIGLRNSLIVECVFCDLRIHELRTKLRDHLAFTGKSKDEIKRTISDVKIQIEPFSIVKDKLLDVIYTNPTSSYAYNALFRKFIADYEDNLTNMEKVKYLSEMLSLIAEVDNNNNDVMYEDEYAIQALKVESLAQFGTRGITIDNIDQVASNQDCREDLFRGYYRALLNEKNASGIYLLADNARKEAGIDYKTPLTEGQEDSCKRIIAFLSREDYEEAVVQNPGCQYMLLRLKWMIYNRAPIFSGRECQLTRMSANQWREIAAICNSYASNFLKNGKHNYNAATIYYLLGLASAQLGDYEVSHQAFRKISEESFFSQVRNKTWHMLCNENGEPVNFLGEFDESKSDSHKRTGRAYVIGLSKSREDTIYYHLPNLDWSSVHPGIHKDLEIGVNYIGFSIYRAAGRMRRQ